MKCNNCYLRYHCDEQTEFICKHNDYCKYMLEQNNESNKSCLNWLERLELTKAIMGRGIDYETAELILNDFQKRMNRF